MGTATTPMTFSCSLAIGVAFLAAVSFVVASLAGPVPAVYVFGDSLADIGKNNHLLTLFRANFPPYGIDYPGKKATGRFSNGKNFADFVAENLGLETSPPYLALLSSRDGNYANGVNFASGGAGISNATNEDKCLSFETQIDYFSSVHASLVQSLGEQQAATHLAKSLFAITIGVNDIAHYTDSISVNDEAATSTQTTQQFVDTLVQPLAGQLQRLYDLGLRKLLFVGAAPVGCFPSLRELSAARDCNAVANDAAVRYNAAAASLLGGMAARRPDMRYAFFDTHATLLRYIDDPAAYGFTEAKAACYELKAKIGCTPLSFFCANRTSHVFWDIYHPTEQAVRMLTRTAFDGSAPLVFPMNIRHLISAI